MKWERDRGVGSGNVLESGFELGTPSAKFDDILK